MYFALTFVDEDMFIPTMETVVFVGRDLEPGDVGRVYFRDVCSVTEGLDSAEWDYTASVDSISHIFEFDRALDQLLACSIRRSM